MHRQAPCSPIHLLSSRRCSSVTRFSDLGMTPSQFKERMMQIGIEIPPDIIKMLMDHNSSGAATFNTFAAAFERLSLAGAAPALSVRTAGECFSGSTLAFLQVAALPPSLAAAASSTDRFVPLAGLLMVLSSSSSTSTSRVSTCRGGKEFRKRPHVLVP